MESCASVPSDVLVRVCVLRGGKRGGGALEWDCFRPTYTRHDLHLGCGLLCRRLAAAGEKGDKSGFGTREGRGSHRQDMTGGNARGGDEGFAGMLPESRESRQFLESGAVVLAAARSTSRAGRLGQGTGAGALSVSICRWARCKTGRRRGFVGGQDRSGGLVAAGDAVVGGKTRPDLSNTHNRSGSGPSEVSAADGEAIKRETCEVRGRDGAALSCGLAARAWSGRDCTQAAPHFRRPNLSPASEGSGQNPRRRGAGVGLRMEGRKKMIGRPEKRPSPKHTHTHSHTRRRHAGGQDKGKRETGGRKNNGPDWTGTTTQTMLDGRNRPGHGCPLLGGPVFGAWGRWLSGPHLGSNATVTARRAR